ncbi:hypothetical protein Ancab_004704, partial [Ancistrocladus abbreviatus]
RIWDFLSHLGILDGQNKDREIHHITEMETRDAAMVARNSKEDQTKGGQVDNRVL